MFQQIPAEVVAAIIESAGEIYLKQLRRNKMAHLNYELLLLGSSLLDEPWAEGEEGENDTRAKSSTSPTEEDSDRPNSNSDPISKEELHIKTESSPIGEDNTSDNEDLSPKSHSSPHPGENEESPSPNPIIKTEPSDDNITPIIPKLRKNPSPHNNTDEMESKPSSKTVGMERCTPPRSRGSNLGDSSEVEHSETDEVDDRRLSSRREQDFGNSSSRSRSPPERPGSEVGTSPGPYTAQQQQQFLQASIPYLHLLPPHIRNDAARLFLMPQMLPPEFTAAAAAAAAASSSNPSPSPGSSGNAGSGGQMKEKSGGTIDNSRSGAMFMCEPCNIKFSSAKTLEAHQTYYCSFRKDAGGNVRIEVEDVKQDLLSSGGTSSKKRDRENSEEQELTMDESMESVDSFPGSQNKSQKTGKLYTCVYCSYSADKKVSLNRHMRMHSGLSISANQMPNIQTKEDSQGGGGSGVGGVVVSASSRPVTPGKSPSSSATPNSNSSKNIQDGVSALERYCQDCDIQFSSIKTFRVHKQYYCSTRHVLKAQQTAVAAAVAAAAAACAAGGGGNVVPAALGKAPVELGPGVTVTPVGKSSASVGSACSPIPGDGSPASTPGPMASQPFVVLPTNPIIVVPYCFIQGASFLPGNVLPSQNAIVVLPNGTVQSLPGTGATGAGGIPIPVPSPSPQSMILGSHLMMHSPYPTGATPGPSSIMSPNNLSFPDPKEMMKLMESRSKDSRDDGEMMLSPNKLPKPSSRNSGRSSRSSEDASDSHHGKGHHNHHLIHATTNDTCDDGSMPAIDLTFRGIQPKKEIPIGGSTSATTSTADDEKENREEICASVGSRNSRNVSRDSIPGTLEEHHHASRSRSVTPATSITGHATSSNNAAGHHQTHETMNSSSSSTHHHRDRESPLEKMSMGSGSGGKRTPRPSSASVSSSCSTPPTLCEPKINGMMSQMISPSGKDSSHDPTALNNKMVMMMLNAGAAAAAAALESGNVTNSTSSSSQRGKKGSGGNIDYSSMTMTRSRGSSSSSGVNGGKISPMATQLPGGAILTSATNNQSLAELLMTNPPELNESLAKLNPQLLMNAHRAAAAAAVGSSSPVGFNFNINPAFMQALSPEIAMRLLDPAYLSTLQQSLQQQQQQAQQTTSSTPPQAPQVPVKRGVSKCVECDIVFYKTENYLVHKEYYCAARGNNNSTPSSNIYPPQSKTPTAGSSKGSGKGSNNGTRGKDGCRMSSCSSPSKSEVDDEECISPPPPMMHRKVSSGSLRKSPDSMILKPKSKSPQNAMSSPPNVSPVPSPKSFGVGVIKAEGKGGSGSGNQFPCSECGVKFSTVDNLQTHQAFYCNKRKAGTLGLNFGDNGGDMDKSGSNNNGGGEAFMLELLASGQNSHEKEMLAAAQASLSSLRNKSPGPGSGSGRNGFLRCGKCKLPIPEDQMGTHIRVCLGTVNPSFGNGRGVGNNGNGNGNDIGVGWKCPCCDVYSPTVSAAQKHLETHTGIRAFKCLLCGYRGNTLRGMRTHIRTHFDKRVFDLLEGDYMTCITANDVEPSTSSTSSTTSSSGNNGNNNSILSQPELLHRAIAIQQQSQSANNAVSGAINRSSGSLSEPKNNGKGGSGGSGSRFSPETCNKNVNQAKSEENNSPTPSSYGEDIQGDIKVFQSPSDMMMMTMMTENDSNASANSSENNNQLHYCNLCNFTSPFKANILKHMKLVHKVQIPIDMGEAEAASMLMLHGSLPEHHDGLSNTIPIIHRSNNASGGVVGSDPLMDDMNGMNESSSRNSTPKPTPHDFQAFPGVKSASSSQSPTSVQESQSQSRTRRSASNAGASQSQQLPNGTSGIALDIKEESLLSSDGVKRKSSSHSSAEEDDNTKEKHQSTSGNTGSNYCKSCDISFNYVSSFNAHKKFYCSSLLSSSDTEAPERAETPVQ